MAIRFKFRSSANFDAVHIEDDRPCISVGDLKTRIRRLKNLNICSGSDLRISDAVTGEEYRDDNVQIPSGSSVIIKRVPAGSVSPLAIHTNDAVENLGINDINHGVISTPDDKDRTLKKPSLRMKEDIIDFDDFGDDVCPVLERMVDDSSFNVEKKCSISSESAKIGAARCHKLTTELGRRLDDSDRNEAVSRGPLAMGIGRDKLLVEGKTKTDEPSKLQKTINASFIATQNADLPSELKCSLCNAPYDEAVMIPCCQNSYCERCIRPVLNEKSCCPNCSAKCRAEDLLPNVSLRHAVETFLRSQVFAGGVEDVHHHAPDGESGIQGKEASDDLTMVKRGSESCQPSKITGKRPGNVISESALDWTFRNKAVTAGCCSNIDATERISNEEIWWCFLILK
ncbi:E3 ubiquitin ligase PARAQUAT TOLERANCE 3-like [Rhodamnia argentea]|uniref:E3 ubiquitin ligase PARAQUAT TOLERANCE 3-like n=1 Tax=Rhodamnia argentea TaxID=178133 RepID=A0ABM3HBT1_9MYRT|nr:E3 ubiquitin ligase PARAQUAT TOLERANCE 3-like [Rhodamnia argentea]